MLEGQTDRQTDRLTERQTDRHTDTNRDKERQTDSQTDRDRYRDRCIEKQNHSWIDAQIDILKLNEWMDKLMNKWLHGVKNHTSYRLCKQLAFLLTQQSLHWSSPKTEYHRQPQFQQTLLTCVLDTCAVCNAVQIHGIQRCPDGTIHREPKPKTANTSRSRHLWRKI